MKIRLLQPRAFACRAASLRKARTQIHPITLVLAALTLAGVSTASAAGVSGRWQADFESPIGQLKYTYDLQTDGTNLTGKTIRELAGEKTEAEVKAGKVAGDEVSFVELLRRDDQEIQIDYKGKLAGDEIKFTRKVGDFATMEIVAKRAPASVDGQWRAEFDTQTGKQKYLFTFKSEGNQINGKASAEIGAEKIESELKKVKLEGETLTFSETLKYQGKEVWIGYTGKLAGDEIKFLRNVADFTTEELVARRVRPPATTINAVPK